MLHVLASMHGAKRVQPQSSSSMKTMGARVVLLVVVAWSAAASNPDDEASDAHSEVVDVLMER
jgi:hypothetical protein